MTGAAPLPGEMWSPTVAVLQIGPFAVHAYAVCILVGIALAVWVTGRRLTLLGYPREHLLDISGYAVVFGIVGGRLYHLVTTPQPYFGAGGHPWDALKIWNGGLGIWGAVALGALGAWLGCRRYGLPFLAFADAAAPGVALAQAVGRWGNWFNNELYGAPTTLPWGVQIHQWDAGAGRAVLDPQGHPVLLGTYQPTFLYESVFLLVLALLLVLRDRWTLRPRGEVFALYVAGYPLGRVVVELMRTDEANVILGQRVNVWTSLLVFLVGLVLLARSHRRGATTRHTEV